MAYFRGDNYVWRDETGFHFWAKDGYDSWDTTAWAVDEKEKRLPGYENASGVSVHEDIMDAFVMMRVAQLIYEGKADEVIDCVSNDLGGNFGSMMLMRNATTLKEAFRTIKLTDAEPYVWPPIDENETETD